jgi:hypothetical protein
VLFEEWEMKVMERTEERKGGGLKSSENENVKEDSVRISSMSITQSRESVGTRWQSNPEELATLAVRWMTRFRETLWPSKDQLPISRREVERNGGRRQYEGSTRQEEI